jgi:hypothetical protein
MWALKILKSFQWCRYVEKENSQGYLGHAGEAKDLGSQFWMSKGNVKCAVFEASGI